MESTHNWFLKEKWEELVSNLNERIVILIQIFAALLLFFSLYDQLKTRGGTCGQHGCLLSRSCVFQNSALTSKFIYQSMSWWFGREMAESFSPLFLFCPMRLSLQASCHLYVLLSSFLVLNETPCNITLKAFFTVPSLITRPLPVLS